jgi:hypothetical protein
MKGMVSKGKLEQVYFPAPAPVLQEKFGRAFDRLLMLNRRQELAQADSEKMFQSALAYAFLGDGAKPNGSSDTLVDAYGKAT